MQQFDGNRHSTLLERKLHMAYLVPILTAAFSLILPRHVDLQT